MFELNEKEIAEFKRLWHDKTNEQLTDERAQVLGSRLVAQVAALYDLI